MTSNTKIQNLFKFCISGDRIGLADYIITNKCNPSSYDARDSNGQTALHIACQHGHLFVVRSLIEIFGCSPAIVDKLKNSPLHIACLNGHLPIIDHLFSFIEDDNITNAIFMPDSEGNNLLHKACQSGSVPTVRYILHALCFNKQLIYKKLNLFNDNIILYDTTSSALFSCTQLHSLISCIIKENNIGENAIHIACRHGHLAILKLFQALYPYNGFLNSLNFIAIQCRHVDTINFLEIVKNHPVVDFNSEILGLKQGLNTFLISPDVRYDNVYGSITVTCTVCQHSISNRHVTDFNRAKKTGFCPNCNKKQFKFKCQSCSFVFHDDRVFKINCSKCKCSELDLILQPSKTSFEQVLLFSHAQHNIKQTYLHAKTAAMQGDIKLCQQVSGRFTEKSILHAACISDNVDLVRHIMETLNVEVNEVDDRGNTPLHVVCEWGSWNAFLHLLSFSDLDLNKTNSVNQTPFSLACKYSRERFINKLFEYNIKIDSIALHIACENGQLELAEKLIKHWGSSMINSVDQYGDTFLFDACRSKSLELVKFLVKEGSNPLFVNETTKDTPIHIACRMGRPDVLEALCQSRHIKDKSLNPNILGIFPTHLAMENKCFQLVEILIKYCSVNLNLTINKNKVTLAQIAYQLQNVHFLKILLQQPSVDWNAQNGDGNTLLHLACIDNNEEIVKMILKRASKSITIQNLKKETPVHNAVSVFNLSLLKELLQHLSGSLDRCVDEQNNTILHLVCEKHFLDTDLEMSIICLLTKFCSAISQNGHQQTPLHLACKLKNSTVIKHLLESVPESNALNKLLNEDGSTILHVAAAQNPFVDVVECILEHTISMISCKNSLTGQTPVHIACMRGNVQIVKTLVSKATHVHSDSGDSYLHSACHGKTLEVVNFLLDNSQFDHQSLLCANKEGNTPLYLACMYGSGAIIKSIYRYCSTPLLHLENESRMTPLFGLLRNKHFKVIKDMIKNKIIDDQWSYCDKPLIHLLIENVQIDRQCTIDLIKFIISGKYCDYLKCDEKRNNILHCFVFKIPNFSDMLFYRLWSDLLRLPDAPINQQNQNGDTPLHLLCTRETNKLVSDSTLRMNSKLITELLTNWESAIKESLVAKNKQGKTPIQLASKQVMRLLIRYGANLEDVYTEFGSMLDKIKSKHPLKSYMKIIVVGNSAAGKTTLVEALNLVSKGAHGTLVENDDGPTAGVKESTLDSKELGHVTFHDFAGQPEFESSNSIVLENSVSLEQPPIFLLLADVSTDYETLKKHIQYWFTFIQNHSPQQLQTPPHVIIIGSHSDCIQESQYPHIENCMKTAINSIPSSTFHTIGPLLLDCRKVDAKLQKLNKMLAKSCTSLRKTVEVDIRCHILFAYLSKWFGTKIFIKFFEMQAKIKFQSEIKVSINLDSIGNPDSKKNDHSHDFLLPFTTDALLDLLKSLHDGGHILLLNTEYLDNCWILTDRHSLFEEVNGKLFAPKSFEGRKLQTNTGVVSEDMLSSLFENSIDINLITTYTVYSEFCRKIEDSMTLELIEGNSINKSNITAGLSDNTVYYFFPCLVQSERPNDIWQCSSLSVRNFGWYLQCKSNTFLDPRFLHVVLLRLTFTFAVTDSPDDSFQDTNSDTRLLRKCSFWKSGIHWGTRSGIEVLIELIEHNSAVVFLVRYIKDHEMEGIKLRSQIINMILDAKNEFCPKTKVTEYFLPECSIYPIPSDIVQEKVSIHEIAQSGTKRDNTCALNSKHKPVPLTDLLFFDPYLKIGQDLIEQLWSEACSEEEIPSRFLLELSEAQRNFVEQITKLLNILQSEVDTHKEKCEKNPVKLLLHIYESWKSKQDKPCFENLRKIFNSHSIFSGRNPLEVSEFVSLDYSQGSDQQPEGERPDSKRSMYESENHTLEGKSEESQHTSTFLFPENKPLLDCVSLKHLMCIKWRDAEIEHKLHILKDASTSWRKIAETVHMPQDMITALDQETKKPSQDCTCDVFKWWIDQSGTKRYNKTWEGLHLLLNDSGLPRLAQQLHEAIINPENSVLKLNPLKSKSNTKRVSGSHQRRKRRFSGASNY